MLVQIQEKDLNSRILSWICIEPILLLIRGKSLEEKADIYLNLNLQQQALFMFYSFHNHVNSPEELYWYATYFIFDIKAWDELKTKIAIFGNLDILNTLELLEKSINLSIQRTENRLKEFSTTDLEKDPILQTNIHQLFEAYKNHSENYILLLNRYIRMNGEKFIEKKIVKI